MSVQDFFSVVQLGAGLHFGTALLQLAGGLESASMDRRFQALQNWAIEARDEGVDTGEVFDQIKNLRASIERFKSQHDQEYRKFAYVMLAIGCILSIKLSVMSFFASCDAPTWLGASFVLISIAPVFIIYAIITYRTKRHTSVISPKFDDIREALLKI